MTVQNEGNIIYSSTTSSDVKWSLRWPYLSPSCLRCLQPCSRRVWQLVVLDLWIMIYYPIKPPDIQREKLREKIKCELLFPLMSTLFLFLLSDPTLGNREPPVSLLLPGLVKHDHTATRSPWPLIADPPKSHGHRTARGMVEACHD